MEAILEEELEVDNFKGPEPIGCWKSFINGVSSIWSTSDLLTGEETEERVRTVTRELAVYLVFLGILCWGKYLVKYVHQDDNQYTHYNILSCQTRKQRPL